MIENRNGLIIRAAVQTDMAPVLELIRELAVYENAPNEVTNTVENLVNDGFGPNKVFDCFVASSNEKIVGFTLFYTSYSTWKGTCIYLEDLLVTEAWRRQGVGKLLFDAVVAVAEKRGVKRLEWQVLDWNTPAINFYKKYKTIFDTTWVDCKLTF